MPSTAIIAVSAATIAASSANLAAQESNKKICVTLDGETCQPNQPKVCTTQDGKVCEQPLTVAEGAVIVGIMLIIGLVCCIAAAWWYE